MSFCNRIEQAELGYWIHYATFRQDQPPDLEWRRLERSTRFDREVRARVSRETGRAADVISCYEAGYDGFCYTGYSKRMVYATTLLIRQACRWTDGRNE